MADVLRATLAALTRAVLEHDQAAAEQLLGETYVLTSAGGVAPRLERAEWRVSRRIA